MKKIIGLAAAASAVLVPAAAYAQSATSPATPVAAQQPTSVNNAVSPEENKEIRTLINYFVFEHRFHANPTTQQELALQASMQDEAAANPRLALDRLRFLKSNIDFTMNIADFPTEGRAYGMSGDTASYFFDLEIAPDNVSTFPIIEASIKSVVSYMQEYSFGLPQECAQGSLIAGSAICSRSGTEKRYQLRQRASALAAG